MKSHKRIYIDANYKAMRELTPSAYKILMCLTTHADGLGRCFPTQDTIAEECGCHLNTVKKALKPIKTTGFMIYLRKGVLDPVTGIKLPNVYMISPEFLVIASENESEATKLWQSRGGKLLNNP